MHKGSDNSMDNTYQNMEKKGPQLNLKTLKLF